MATSEHKIHEMIKSLEIDDLNKVKKICDQYIKKHRICKETKDVRHRMKNIVKKHPDLKKLGKLIKKIKCIDFVDDAGTLYLDRLVVYKIESERFGFYAQQDHWDDDDDSIRYVSLDNDIINSPHSDNHCYKEICANRVELVKYSYDELDLDSSLEEYFRFICMMRNGYYDKDNSKQFKKEINKSEDL